MYSPPMGDTFFSQVQLPSDELIRTQTRLFSLRFTRRSHANSPDATGHNRSRFPGLGLGSMVASASENLGMMGSRKKEKGKGKKRQRAYTVGSMQNPDHLDSLAVPKPPPLPTRMPPSGDTVRSSNMGPLVPPQSPKAGDGKKAWHTLKRILSKPHLPSGSGQGGGSPGTSTVW